MIFGASLGEYKVSAVYIFCNHHRLLLAGVVLRLRLGENGPFWITGRRGGA